MISGFIGEPLRSALRRMPQAGFPPLGFRLATVAGMVDASSRGKYLAFNLYGQTGGNMLPRFLKIPRED